MRILVTGGAGFIGSAVIRHFSYSVDADLILNLDKLTYAGNLSSLRSVAQSKRYQFIKADVCDERALAQVFKVYAPTAVLHLAAESHVDRSITGSRAFIETNVLGTHTLLEAARVYWESLAREERDRFRFLHISTDEVYGSLGPEGLFTETTPYAPSSPYSASKAASDHLALAWYRTYGLPVIVSNCSNNYGPYQFPEKLIPHMILNAIHGRELPVYGTGANVRDWLYVDDHAQALALLLASGRPGETYNVGGRNERTNREVVAAICAALSQWRPVKREKYYEDLIRFVPDRPGHDARYAIDASKIERELGWRAKETFESGLSKTVRWYLDNEWWWGPLRAVAGERLGLPVTAA